MCTWLVASGEEERMRNTNKINEIKKNTLEGSVKGDFFYRQLIDKIIEKVPYRGVAQIASATGFTRSALSQRLSKDDTSFMAGDMLCALLAFFKAEIFFPGEDKPISIDKPHDAEIDRLTKLCDSQQKTIDQQARLIEILLEAKETTAGTGKYE